MGVEHWKNNTYTVKSKHSEGNLAQCHCPPQIPYGLAYKRTQESVVRGAGLTVRAIYIQWEK